MLAMPQPWRRQEDEDIRETGENMPDPSEAHLMEKVRMALRRPEPLRIAPKPPIMVDAVTRLVQKNANLREVFLKCAEQAKFQIEKVSEAELPEKIDAFLKLHNCKSIGIPASPLLDRLNVRSALQFRDFSVLGWGELTLDSSYELDCGITDVFAAVAETGSIAICPNPQNGRALSLLPPIHIAIVDQSNMVADLIDLMEIISARKPRPQITLITGPSKTADIEGGLVTGVHGPGLVQIFFLTGN
jgi:L-lactate utilization protein LutC